MTSSTDDIILNSFQITNPSSYTLFIKSEQEEIYPVAIYDLVGNLVHFSEEQGDASIDISDLSSAIYIVRIGNSVTRVMVSH